MKPAYLIAALLLLFLSAAQAEKKPGRKDLKIRKPGNVQFSFNNIAPAEDHKDSFLIIFDRYNHTGPGVVCQVYSADKDQHIRIEGVPAGKYYVTMKGLGLHRDFVEKVVTIRTAKDSKMNIVLQELEEFSKDKVVIPPYTPNFEDMAVMKTH